MEDINAVVTLLVIIVVMLSLVIIALLVMMTIVLIKLKKLTNDAKVLTHNLTSATKWLNPATVFNELMHAIRRK